MEDGWYWQRGNMIGNGSSGSCRRWFLEETSAEIKCYWKQGKSVILEEEGIMNIN